MSNTVTTAANRVVVITTVQPAGNGMGVTSAPYFMGQTVSKKLGRFQLGHPKALGTVQIMIALVMLLIGIVMAWSPRPDNIGVLSGIFVYGSIIFVIAGSLTVAADNHLNKCRVKGSLGMNVVAAVTSFFGIFLYSMDTGGIMLYFYCNHPASHDQYYNTDIVYSRCPAYLTRSQGISGVLVILSLLEFIVSICVSSFGCKAVCQCCKCCHTPEQVIIFGEQILVPQVGMMPPNPAGVLPRCETVNNPKDPERESMGTEFLQSNPPSQYNYAFP